MGKRKELGSRGKSLTGGGISCGTAADARGGAASWGGSLHHGELDQPVSLGGGIWAAGKWEPGKAAV